MPYTNPVEIPTLKTEIEKFKAIADEAAISPVVLGNLLYQLASHINKAAAAFGVPPNIPYAETFALQVLENAVKLKFTYRQPDGYDKFPELTIPLASEAKGLAGLMSPDDKRMLGIVANLAQSMQAGGDDSFIWAEGLRDWFNDSNDIENFNALYAELKNCEFELDDLINPGYYRMPDGMIVIVSASASEKVNNTTARWSVTQTQIAHDGLRTRTASVTKSGRQTTIGIWSEWHGMESESSLWIEFGGMVSDVTVAQASTAHLSTDSGCTVVFDTENGRFLIQVGSGGITAGGGTTDKYYGNWPDAVKFGEMQDGDWKPKAGILYVSADNVPYRWDGSSLVSMVPEGYGELKATLDTLVKECKTLRFQMDHILEVFEKNGW